MAQVCVSAARLFALMVVCDFSNFARVEANFDIPSGDPHGGCGGISLGDHCDRIADFIMGEGNSEVALDLFNRRCAEL